MPLKFHTLLKLAKGLIQICIKSKTVSFANESLKCAADKTNGDFLNHDDKSEHAAP